MKVVRASFWCLSMFFVASVFAASLYAEGEAMERGSGPCKADREKFCRGVEPGQGRIWKCLKEHQGELAAECSAAMEQGKAKMRERVQQAHSACKDDVAKFCGEIEGGGGRILHCLKQNEASLSAGCKSGLPGGRTGGMRGQGGMPRNQSGG